MIVCVLMVLLARLSRNEHVSHTNCSLKVSLNFIKSFVHKFMIVWLRSDSFFSSYFQWKLEYSVYDIEKKKHDCILLLRYVPCYRCRVICTLLPMSRAFFIDFFVLKHIYIFKYFGFQTEQEARPHVDYFFWQDQRLTKRLWTSWSNRTLHAEATRGEVWLRRRAVEVHGLDIVRPCCLCYQVVGANSNAFVGFVVRDHRHPRPMPHAEIPPFRSLRW